MATQNNTVVRDGNGALVTRRSFNKDGVIADAPFIPEVGETSDEPWAGSGAGGVISVLKAIWTRLASVGLAYSGNPVSVVHPLPATLANGASGVAPVTGNFTAIGYSNPFTPVPGRPFNISGWAPSGFSGTITIERSFNGGVTKMPLTALGASLFSLTGPFSEILQEDEYGVQYFLHCTVFGSGSMNYRMSA